MSNSKNQIVSIWQAVETSFRCSSYTYQGVPMRPPQCKLVAEAYTLWYLCTEDLLRSGGVTREQIDHRWINSIRGLDVREVARSLKSADQMLLTDHSVCDYESFKRSLRIENPHIGDILSPMKQVFAMWFLQRDHGAFALLHCFLCFVSRLNINGLAVLEDEAMKEYLAIEETLMSDGFTDEESSLLATWYPRTLELEAFYCEHFEPRHGQGSTADAGKDMLEKYLHLGTDPRISYLRGRLAEKADYPRSPVTFERSAKLSMVPKSLLTYRSVSAEPATLMWYQQGIRNAFTDDLLTRHRKGLARRYRPDTQEPNRERAWEGSIDGSFATIDLSSASDSVSWALVRRWFRDTVLFPWLLCSRSLRVQLSEEETMHLGKFAPMGSALCFPVEVLVFCAITECAIKEAGGDPALSRYQVYGDDIVVESEYAHHVISRLERNGFRVNTHKSFFSQDPDWIFRESCGGEYLDGVDVTPVRISRGFTGLDADVHHPGKIESLIEMANDCYSRLPSVRRRILHSLLSLPQSVGILFDGTGERGIFSPNPTNFHLEDPAWSDRYQCLLIKHGRSTVRKIRIDSRRVEDIRLFEYLRQSNERRRLTYPEDRISVDLRPIRAGKWTLTRSPVES